MPRRLRRLDLGTWMVGLGWAAAVYSVHKYGALAGWYLTYPWFQNVTHAGSASGVGVLLGLVGLELGYRRGRLLLFVVGLSALGAVGWELVEYLGWLDNYGVYLYFHDLNDAAVDMVSNAVGTTVALAYLWWRTGLDPAWRRQIGADARGG